MSLFKVSLDTFDGMQEVGFDLEDYLAADNAKMSFSDYINHKYPCDPSKGTAIEQCYAATGLIIPDRHSGRSPTLDQIFTGQTQMADAIVAPDGDARLTLAGRFFYPTLLIDTLEASLRENNDSYNAAFMEMVAFTRSITSAKYDQVIIDYSRPQGARSEQISQLAEPVKMMSITTSSISRAIPTWSIGMEISKEAQAAATLDLVAIALREQGAAERAERLSSDFMGIVNGDVDAGEAGLMSGAISGATLDPDVVAPGKVSQRMWIKYLMQGWKKRNITHVVCNIDQYLEIQNRSGRPVKADEGAADESLMNTVPQIMLPMIPRGVKVFPMEDFPANLIVGLDSSKAMRRIINVSAEYKATVEFVMRKSSALRVDYSERIESAGYPEAFSVLALPGNPVS